MFFSRCSTFTISLTSILDMFESAVQHSWRHKGCQEASLTISARICESYYRVSNRFWMQTFVLTLTPNPSGLYMVSSILHTDLKPLSPLYTTSLVQFASRPKYSLKLVRARLDEYFIIIRIVNFNNQLTGLLYGYKDTVMAAYKSTRGMQLT